jgi:hypothetical protein
MLTTLGIGFNALYADNSEENQALRDFLNEVAGEWTATQTTAPEGIWIEAADNTSVTLNWPAMGFSDYSGGYKVEYRRFSDSAFDRSETAVGKDNTTLTVGKLEPNTCYAFRVKSVTDPLDDGFSPDGFNQNTVTSDHFFWQWEGDGVGDEFVSNAIWGYTSPDYWYYIYNCYEYYGDP